MLQSRSAAPLVAWLGLATQAAAATVGVPIPSIGAADGATIAETARFDFSFAPSPVGLWTAAFETEHQTDLSVLFSNVRTTAVIEHPDVVVPGETVALSGEVLHFPFANQGRDTVTFDSEVAFDMSLGLLQSDGTFLGIIDTSLLPGGPLTGSLSGVNTGTESTRFFDATVPSSDATGFGGLAPAVPLGTPTAGFSAEAARSFEAWQFEEQRLLETAAVVVPGLDFFDIALSADYTITERYGFSSDLVTAYYSLPGEAPGSRSFALNAPGVTPTITIPDNVEPDSLFEVALDTLTVNYTATLDYLVDGTLEYQFLTCLPLLGCTEFGDPVGDTRDNELVASWLYQGQLIVDTDAVLSFDVAPVPLPGTAALLLAGLAGLAAAGRARKPRGAGSRRGSTRRADMAISAQFRTVAHSS